MINTPHQFIATMLVKYPSSFNGPLKIDVFMKVADFFFSSTNGRRTLKQFTHVLSELPLLGTFDTVKKFIGMPFFYAHLMDQHSTIIVPECNKCQFDVDTKWTPCKSHIEKWSPIGDYLPENLPCLDDIYELGDEWVKMAYCYYRILLRCAKKNILFGDECPEHEKQIIITSLTEYIRDLRGFMQIK